MMNSALYAMRKFQEQMRGQAAKVGLMSEDDVAEWITRSRREENADPHIVSAAGFLDS